MEITFRYQTNERVTMKWQRKSSVKLPRTGGNYQKFQLGKLFVQRDMTQEYLWPAPMVLIIAGRRVLFVSIRMYLHIEHINGVSFYF